MTRTAEQELSGDYQREVGRLVEREISYCVSTLIAYLAKDDSNEHYDDILSVCVSDDWETPATDEGWRQDKADTELFHHNDHPAICARDWQDLCDQESIEPFQDEALEHWIISDWLADKLEAAGEMVARDIHGLTIWGRTTSGQAILLDRAICDIYDELHAPAKEAA